MTAPLTLTQGRLDPALQARYRDQGYLSPIPVMQAAEAATLRARLETLEATWLDNGLPLPLNTYKRVNAHCVMTLAHQIATDPRILDVVEGILGPDILIYGVEFFIKEPRTRAMVTMHQDLTYWGFGAIDGMVTAWLALSPATPASGCMEFVAGSHKNPILPHADTFAEDNLLSRGQEIAVEVPLADRTPIILQPGEMSLHHGLMIHGSGPNTTDDRRIGAVVRYCAPQIAQQVAEKDYAILARGADRVNNFIHFAPPRSDFAPEALSLYEEIRAAQAKALMAGTSNTRGLYA